MQVSILLHATVTPLLDFMFLFLLLGSDALQDGGIYELCLSWICSAFTNHKAQHACMGSIS